MRSSGDGRDLPVHVALQCIHHRLRSHSLGYEHAGLIALANAQHLTCVMGPKDDYIHALGVRRKRNPRSVPSHVMTLSRCGADGRGNKRPSQLRGDPPTASCGFDARGALAVPKALICLVDGKSRTRHVTSSPRFPARRVRERFQRADVAVDQDGEILAVSGLRPGRAGHPPGLRQPTEPPVRSGTGSVTVHRSGFRALTPEVDRGKQAGLRNGPWPGRAGTRSQLTRANRGLAR